MYLKPFSRLDKLQVHGPPGEKCRLTNGTQCQIDVSVSVPKLNRAPEVRSLGEKSTLLDEFISHSSSHSNTSGSRPALLRNPVTTAKIGGRVTSQRSKLDLPGKLIIIRPSSSVNKP